MRGLVIALSALALLLPLLPSLAPPALAEEQIVSGLSQTRVSITADFDGSEILVYGAIKRDAPAPEGPIDVIITAEGPSLPITIRKKDRVAGIWLNKESLPIDAAPSFYSVVTTAPLEHILAKDENFKHSITIDRLVRSQALHDQDFGQDDFIKGLIRVRSGEGLYRRLENRITLSEDTLFRADIALPSNLTEGQYRIRMFLLRGGKVISEQRKTIFVRKEGLERAIHSLATKEPLLYGIVSLIFAAFAGWAASTAFRYLRL